MTQDVCTLKVAAAASGVSSLGPGLRAAVWVQGCPFHCPSCLAPDWIPFEGAPYEITPSGLADMLLADDRISGLTLSGGEPFAQAEGLARMLRIARRRRRELNVISFTGYRYETLEDHPHSPWIHALLNQVDVLIDGPYIARLNNGKGLRGSSNQRILHLTNRLRDFAFEDEPRSIEIVIGNGELLAVGIPPGKALQSLESITGAGMKRAMLKAGVHERA
ncbi:MAG: radical SAM protein [Anaerolineaceae bacterium]|nr:radical SAM protein [Anaerolineaceae bacterium]